jgi:hypothetical protein
MIMTGVILPSCLQMRDFNCQDAVCAGAVQFPEILSDEILTKMHAAPKADVPVATVQDLPNYDGFIMGFPTRCAATCSRFRDMAGVHDGAAGCRVLSKGIFSHVPLHCGALPIRRLTEPSPGRQSTSDATGPLAGLSCRMSPALSHEIHQDTGCSCMRIC